ncbi:MAG: macro domain-containing protein [Deltaproteobacteria bacterium]|jgi:O-acetyl-ADP-ribose deacetylase (regulator of RNase III)|nr:macro domain-containing protein [Deltaproteobacteria bacterium]
MPFLFKVGDIVEQEVCAVVNAANTSLSMGGGVCGAIFKAAGAAEVTRECRAIGGCPTGGAVATKGYNLAAKYIIHTVGPVWSGGDKGEPKLLSDCYLNSLELAKQSNCRSIAFPLISSGIYGYPKDLAIEVALKAIAVFLKSELDFEVRLILREPVKIGWLKLAKSLALVPIIEKLAS